MEAFHEQRGFERSRRQEEFVRVELGYCPRCGKLRFFFAGGSEEFCSDCRAGLRWLRGREAGGERAGRKHPAPRPLPGARQ